MNDKQCSRCKLIKPIEKFSRCKKYKDGYHYQCKDCDKQYRIANKSRLSDLSKQYRQANRRVLNEKSVKYHRDIKQILIDEHGGKCCICGYNKYFGSLEFHHKNPAEKDFSIAKKRGDMERAREEANKCILVCSNCHKEIHGGFTTLNECAA